LPIATNTALQLSYSYKIQTPGRDDDRDSKVRHALKEQMDRIIMDSQELIYQIKVVGNIDKDWSDYFAGMDVEILHGSEGTIVTSLTGAVADQAALRGMLGKLWDLNVTLISVIKMDTRRKKNDDDR
jgi:hypothetical protein